MMRTLRLPNIDTDRLDERFELCQHLWKEWKSWWGTPLMLLSQKKWRIFPMTYVIYIHGVYRVVIVTSIEYDESKMTGTLNIEAKMIGGLAADDVMNHDDIEAQMWNVLEYVMAQPM